MALLESELGDKCGRLVKALYAQEDELARRFKDGLDPHDPQQLDDYREFQKQGAKLLSEYKYWTSRWYEVLHHE